MSKVKPEVQVEDLFSDETTNKQPQKKSSSYVEAFNKATAIKESLSIELFEDTKWHKPSSANFQEIFKDEGKNEQFLKLHKASDPETKLVNKFYSCRNAGCAYKVRKVFHPFEGSEEQEEVEVTVSGKHAHIKGEGDKVS
jgi:hypothetical protein